MTARRGGGVPGKHIAPVTRISCALLKGIVDDRHVLHLLEHALGEEVLEMRKLLEQAPAFLLHQRRLLLFPAHRRDNRSLSEAALQAPLHHGGSVATVSRSTRY